MNQSELNEIVEKHQHWLKHDCPDWRKMKANLMHADLKDAFLVGANLKSANLWGANLSGADLMDANLSYANLNRVNLNDAMLMNANFSDANFMNATLTGASIFSANFRDASLKFADLSGSSLNFSNFNDANFNDANLSGVDLRGANLSGAWLIGANLYSIITDCNTIGIEMACPEEGTFIGYKKVQNFLVKLEIPAEAKRSSATTRKCRCEFAKVVEITNIKSNEHIDNIANDKYINTIYTVGQYVYPDSYDENRWNECSHGIHFFMSKSDAISYK